MQLAERERIKRELRGSSKRKRTRYAANQRCLFQTTKLERIKAFTSPYSAEALHIAILELVKAESPKGRPFEYCPIIAAEIFHQLCQGKTLFEICDQPGMPIVNAVYVWVDRVQDFARAFERARYYQADGMAYRAIQTVAECPNDRDAGYVARVKAETFLRVAGRLNPAKWSERGDNQAPVNISINTNLDLAKPESKPDGSYVVTLNPEEIKKSKD
ncbi:MAG: hypothetical protein ACR2QC_07940 [Gammaproteobacteria bacterium]